MLSKSTGSASTWSAEVAPWRSTITRPPARNASAIALSSAAAGPAATPPSSADSPAASASAANVLRDPPSMLNPLFRSGTRPYRSSACRTVCGLLGLLQFPLMREQLLDIDLAVEDELRAFGLAHLREGPGRDDRQLLPEHVGADIDRHLVALADKAGRAPDFRGAHRGNAPFRLARRVEREFGAVTVRQILDRADRVV